MIVCPFRVDCGRSENKDLLIARGCFDAESGGWLGSHQNRLQNQLYLYLHHLKLYLPRWLLMALPTTEQLYATLTELGRTLIKYKPWALNPLPKYPEPYREHAYKSTC